MLHVLQSCLRHATPCHATPKCSEAACNWYGDNTPCDAALPRGQAMDEVVSMAAAANACGSPLRVLVASIRAAEHMAMLASRVCNTHKQQHSNEHSCTALTQGRPWLPCDTAYMTPCHPCHVLHCLVSMQVVTLSPLPAGLRYVHIWARCHDATYECGCNASRSG